MLKSSDQLVGHSCSLTMILSHYNLMNKVIEHGLRNMVCCFTNQAHATSYLDSTYLQANSRCRLQNETTILCRAPPVQAVKLPHKTQIRMKNKFGPVYYNVSAELLLTVVEDPTIENLTETLILNGNHEILHINVSFFIKLSDLQ